MHQRTLPVTKQSQIEVHIQLWTEFLTYACENITLPQRRCGRNNGFV